MLSIGLVAILNVVVLVPNVLLVKSSVLYPVAITTIFPLTL